MTTNPEITGIRADFTIPEGEDRRAITVADVYTMLPFENKIYCFELPMPEFLTVLQYSLTRSGSTLLSYMTGVECYFTNLTVNAIIKDGVPLFVDGKWKNGAENKKIKVAVSEFIATSDRVSDGMSNPFCKWLDTDRLISTHTTDNEGALDVLRGEAEKSGGALFIDTKPCYISGRYRNGGTGKKRNVFALPAAYRRSRRHIRHSRHSRDRRYYN